MVSCSAAAADEGLDKKTPSLGLEVVVVDCHMHRERREAAGRKDRVVSIFYKQ